MLNDRESRQFKKSLYQRLQDRPLKPEEHDLYEPIYEREGVEDPVDLMQTTIEFSDTESIQMFSGFRGAGKTTELLRLKRCLERQGYVVLYGDALSYLNPAQEVDIADLLVVLASTFNDALVQEGITTGRESYGERLMNFLMGAQTNIGDLGLQTGRADLGTELKLTFQSSPRFRQELRENLSNRIGDLKRSVDRFFEDAVQSIFKSRGNSIAGVVFLFDQMEQIRGSLSNESLVTKSVERIFAQYLRLLEIPYVHMVYTVPPWLRFMLHNTMRITMLSSIRQWNNDDSRTPYAPGWNSLRSFVWRRFGDGDFETFFGNKPSESILADRLVGLCGGHPRDLLLLLRETVLRADELPISTSVVESAISSVRQNFLPIALDDAKWLDKIGRLRDTALPTGEDNDLNRLTRFLDSHFILYFTNDTEWYDVHPLIREDVAEIVRRANEVKPL